MFKNKPELCISSSIEPIETKSLLGLSCKRFGVRFASIANVFRNINKVKHKILVILTETVNKDFN